MSGKPFVLHAPSIPSVWNGTQAQNLTRPTAVTRPVADGNVFPRFAGITSEELRWVLTGLDIPGGIGAATVAGQEISTAVIYLAAMGDAGAKLGIGEHTTYTIATGLLYPQRVSASHGGEATITLELIGYESAGARTDTIAGDANLSGNVGGAASVYTLGPVLVNTATAITDKLSVEIDFGIETEVIRSDSDIGAKLAIVRAIRPSVTISTYDQAVAATIGRALATSGNGIEVWLRKRAATGFSSGSDHAKFTIATGVIVPEGISGDPHLYSFRGDGFNAAGTASPIAYALASLPA